MFPRLTSLLLIPVLLPQGLYVRFRTPKLPEANGERAGTVGSGKPLKLLILGDSAAAGVGVDCQSRALSGRLVEQLKPHFTLDWSLEATTGHTTKDALARIETMDAFNADIVITSLGVNDVTSSTRPEEWFSLQQQLIDQLQRKFSTKQVIMTPVPPMHLFPALPQPLRWCLGLKAKALNHQLVRLVQHYPSCRIVKPEFELDPSLMAKDGFHPGEKLYEQWAEILAKSVLQSH